MKEICQHILEFIYSHDNYLVTTHMGADGDAYGSVLAMVYFLENIGKKYDIIIHDQKLDTRYQFLWGWQKIVPFNDNLEKKYDAALILDVPSKNRMGDPSTLMPDKNLCVLIDHHPEEDGIAHLNLVDVQASSTCQLVYEILSRSAFQMDDVLALLLFSGIMYDTGRFSFSNTRKRDFEIAADLLSFNVKPNEVANELFFSSSFESMRIIGRGLADMEVQLDGRLCIIFLPLEVMQKNNHGEIEELANYSIAIKGSEVGLFIREANKNFFKVSLRSRGLVNVCKVAKALGGGGHAHAAGCRYKGEFPELKKILISEVHKQLK
jgi:phosphoesterase RecJ-like protein